MNHLPQPPDDVGHPRDIPAGARHIAEEGSLVIREVTLRELNRSDLEARVWRSEIGRYLHGRQH
jgi:hypothetical protein